MALSQVQCLDDNHVNVRFTEGKPEFFYSEEQRLALEVLLQNGPQAFRDEVQKLKIRDFLSEPELQRIAELVEKYRPGGEERDSEEGDQDSLEYWPDKSDVSIPELDLGWPDISSYRGVTRANVYTQPPMEGQAHIKEVVRKMIGQAQKVIAVVMDLFTDVDIFKDLLDAGFKRKVPVYIITEETSVPHFLQMCERAGMHTGHMKNLRVRATRGCEFHTRASLRVRGLLSQKFMFVDGDRAVSGSYSFTWTAARMDRNLITVLTGQAVDIFDKQFRDLYLTSKSVNLQQISLEKEPEPEMAPQVPVPALPSAEVVRKMINPKYALVRTSNMETGSGGASSEKTSEPIKDNSTKGNKAKVKAPEPKEEPAIIHPGLLDLERANMINYLPTWPDPEPPSDVIGFINIRDVNKPIQAHLMRSQLFETSQAIRFKKPIKVQEKSESQDSNPIGEMASHSTKEEEERQKKVSQVAEHKPNLSAPPVPKPRTVQLIFSDQKTDSPEVMKLGVESEKNHSSEGTQFQKTPIGYNRTCGPGEELRIQAHDGGRGFSPHGVSSISSTSEEYFECEDLESAKQGNLPNGLPDADARLKQSSAGPEQREMRLEQRELHRDQRKTKHLHNLITSYPFNTAQPEWEQQKLSRGPVKVVIAKPGSYHRPSKAMAPVIGGHRYWHSKGFACGKPGFGPPMSPNRSISGHNLADGLLQKTDSSRTPFGISYNKLSQVKLLKGKVPSHGGTMQRKTRLESPRSKDVV
ncbi:protein FAM83G [Polypterus senegalus]